MPRGERNPVARFGNLETLVALDASRRRATPRRVRRRRKCRAGGITDGKRSELIRSGLDAFEERGGQVAFTGIGEHRENDAPGLGLPGDVERAGESAPRGD